MITLIGSTTLGIISERRRQRSLGGPDKFVKSGSLLRLTCVLRRSTEAPVYVFWYHEERMINYDLGRGVKVRHARYSSELVVAEAHKSDSGNYSCVPSNARPANINVHILNGEEPAAMQHGSKSFSISLTSRRRHRHLEERLFVFFLLAITFALQIR
ncbi:unnamed protein product [Timema podura]|uniref:Ig-like domain-containing protein n=1 Tax=Timema podura TaxID=61482 RepID=A0ABN7P2T0_TIMPD|nr:unnamed protein product [Timema podura]